MSKILSTRAHEHLTVDYLDKALSPHKSQREIANFESLRKMLGNSSTK